MRSTHSVFEIEFVCHYVDFPISTGFSTDVRDAIRTHEAENATQQHGATAQAGLDLAAHRNSVDTDHADLRELPWFILNNGSAGFLAAFEDRLIIAKVGGIAGFMTGSLGGGRVTTFPLHRHHEHRVQQRAW